MTSRRSRADRLESCSRARSCSLRALRMASALSRVAIGRRSASARRRCCSACSAAALRAAWLRRSSEVSVKARSWSLRAARMTSAVSRVAAGRRSASARRRSCSTCRPAAARWACARRSSEVSAKRLVIEPRCWDISCETPETLARMSSMARSVCASVWERRRSMSASTAWLCWSACWRMRSNADSTARDCPSVCERRRSTSATAACAWAAVPCASCWMRWRARPSASASEPSTVAE